MIQQATITITNMKKEFAPNIATTNGLIQPYHDLGAPTAAEVWTDTKSKRGEQVREEIARKYISSAFKINPKGTIWMLASHRAAQSDTRLTRHNALWKSLKARGLTVPEGDTLPEGLRISKDGIRFYGAKKIKSSELHLAEKIISSEAGAIALEISSDLSASLEILLQSGWLNCGNRIPVEIINAVCSSGGIVLGFVGEFDDDEVGIVSYGSPAILPLCS